MIPKKIHYCWFGGNPLPKDVKKCIESWKKYCPDYEIIKWDESNFDINCCNFVKEAYYNKAWSFVSDYARLKIIYDNGGIYLDTDVELIRNIDDILNSNCYFSLQQEGNYVATGLGFGSVKGTQILQEMMNEYELIKFENNNREKFTCPLINTKVIKKHGNYNNNKISILGENIKIYPAKYFDPISPGDTKNLMCKETYSIHHYSATWTKLSNRLKRKIINLIGQDKINSLKLRKVK